MLTNSSVSVIDCTARLSNLVAKSKDNVETITKLSISSSSSMFEYDNACDRSVLLLQLSHGVNIEHLDKILFNILRNEENRGSQYNNDGFIEALLLGIMKQDVLLNAENDAKDILTDGTSKSDASSLLLQYVYDSSLILRYKGSCCKASLLLAFFKVVCSNIELYSKWCSCPKGAISVTPLDSDADTEINMTSIDYTSVVTHRLKTCHSVVMNIVRYVSVLNSSPVLCCVFSILLCSHQYGTLYLGVMRLKRNHLKVWTVC